MCNITNCFTCESEDSCSMCMTGYITAENGTECVNASTEEDDCPSNITNCETCNALGWCTECSANYTLNGAGGCCPTPSQNVAYCLQYENSCSNTCVKCSKGTFAIGSQNTGGTQCLGFPCQLSNCAYCYNSDVCLVCSEGYNLINGNCTQYNNTCNVNNCANCSSGTCQSCINGYTLYNGVCVCNIQNCLECQGAEFCVSCAFPTIATIVNSAGCVPEIIPYSLCNVPNCQQCNRPNLCAACDPGFALQSNGTCSQITCNSNSNCQLCSENGDICFLPLPGYIQENLFSGNAIPIPSNYSCTVDYCQYCNTSSTSCSQCLPFYSLNRGQCDPISCVDNCILCYETNNCTVCEFSYYLTTDFTCAPLNSSVPDCKNIDPYCIGCTSSTESGVTTNMCTACYFGLTPSSTGQSCEPIDCMVDNCHLCLQEPTFQICIACQQGYFLNSYYQCVSYQPALTTPNCTGIYNCLLCGSDNYCAFCLYNWNNTNGVCTTSIQQFCNVANCESCTDSSTCYTCVDDYAPNSLGGCIPVCGIEYCASCDTTETCGTCSPSF